MAKPINSAEFYKIIREHMHEHWGAIMGLHTLYVFHYGDHVKLRFGANGPHTGMPEKDLPDKLKYALAVRAQPYPWSDIRDPHKPTHSVVFEAKEFNELAASVNLMLVPR